MHCGIRTWEDLHTTREVWVERIHEFPLVVLLIAILSLIPAPTGCFRMRHHADGTVRALQGSVPEGLVPGLSVLESLGSGYYY